MDPLGTRFIDVYRLTTARRRVLSRFQSQGRVQHLPSKLSSEHLESLQEPFFEEKKSVGRDFFKRHRDQFKLGSTKVSRRHQVAGAEAAETEPVRNTCSNFSGCGRTDTDLFFRATDETTFRDFFVQ